MNNKSLMERLLEEGYPPEDIDHHDYDLYVYVTPLTTRVITAWMKYNDYADTLNGLLIQTFKDQITGRMMYDIAFQYIPSLDKKAENLKLSGISEIRSVPFCSCTHRKYLSKNWLGDSTTNEQKG